MSTILNKRRTIILVVIGFIVLLPVIGMQFSTEVDWNALDFLIAGLLLGVIDLAIEVVFLSTKNTKQRLIITAIVLFLVFLVWAELAVGIFGTPLAGS